MKINGRNNTEEEDEKKTFLVVCLSKEIGKRKSFDSEMDMALFWPECGK